MNAENKQSMPIPTADRFWTVPIFPCLRPNSLFGKSRDSVFPFDSDRCYLTSNARSALWIGLKALGLRAGDSILAPAYSCGTELDSIVSQNLLIDFYALDQKLQVDVDSLRDALTPSSRAILVTHYFGFPQRLESILQFADEHGLYVIEDNAHGLFSVDPDHRPLGSRGDISVFSLYKSLPVPDGGALVVNLTDLKPCVDLNRSPPGSRIGALRVLIERTFSARNLTLTRAVTEQFLDPVVAKIKKLLSHRRKYFGNEESARGGRGATAADSGAASCHESSLLTRWILKRQNASEVIDRRRRNYAYLASAMSETNSVQLLFPELPDGCVPLFLPVLEMSQARPLRRKLLDAGIECHGFGFDREYLPESGFDWENRLKTCLTCLPVHQSLSVANLDYIKRVIKEGLSEISMCDGVGA